MAARNTSGTARSLAAVPLARNARDLAFQALHEHKRRGTFVRAIIDERAAAAALPPGERAFAADIAFGVVRRQATLNALLQPHVRRPRHTIEGPLWTLLQVGAYQLAFLESIPPHAAVGETVETAKRLGRRRWAGFVNGTLRAVTRALTDRYTDHPAVDAVPLAPGRYRRCAQPVFPDPESDPAAYFARAFSFPDWLVARWVGRFRFAELVALGFWFNAPQPLTLRVNTLATSRVELLAALSAAGIEATPGELPESIRLSGQPAIEQLPGYAEGWFVIQDETAMRAARLLAPGPGMRVLDLCAAPGTKTTHLAELMENRGRILATEVHAERLALVEQNARRLRIDIIEPQPIQPDGPDLPEGPFDAALVDVPCTNTGVLGKRPEARWRIRPRDLEELPALQRRLLLDACQRLRPGGRVVYSTCSIESDENERVVQAVLGERPGMVLSAESGYIPGRPADGGYQALLVRGG